MERSSGPLKPVFCHHSYHQAIVKQSTEDSPPNEVDAPDYSTLTYSVVSPTLQKQRVKDMWEVFSATEPPRVLNIELGDRVVT